MEKKKQIGFFKRIKMSIFELENYIEFTAESLGKAIWFSLKMVILLSLILSISTVIFVYAKYKSPDNYIDNLLPDFSYEDGNLIIGEYDKKDENKKNIAELMQELEPTYKQFIPNENYTKSDLLNFVKNNEKNIVIVVAIAIFVENILDLFIYWLFIALLTSFIGLIDLSFSRIKMKYSKVYAISIYASTLSIILTVIYNMLNSYFNIYIDLFEYLSILIAYIYVTAVIYMIKSDLLKQQMELIRIATVQAKIKEQMKKEDEEENKKEEQDDQKKDKNDGKEENEEPLDDEPDGSEI